MRLTNALSRSAVLIIVLCVGICLLTAGVFGILSQINSANDGIYVIMLDVTVTGSSSDAFAEAVKSKSGCDNVETYTLSADETEEYIDTIENYSMKDYLGFLIESKNAEMIIVPEKYLDDVLSVPYVTCYGGEINEKRIYKDGMAIKLDNIKITSEGGRLYTPSGSVYGVLLSGDNTEKMAAYLNSLTLTEE